MGGWGELFRALLEISMASSGVSALACTTVKLRKSVHHAQENPPRMTRRCPQPSPRCPAWLVGP